MPRTIISLSDPDKVWLDQQARAMGVPMTEIVRRALRQYRDILRAGDRRGMEELLQAARGTWQAGNGLA